MNDAVLPPQAFDIEDCAAEPIRIPGAIQPHGALLVVDPRTLERLHASANFEDVTGLTLAPGASLASRPEASALVNDIRRWLEGDEPTLLRTVRVGPVLRQVLGHVTPQGAVLEFEDPPRSDVETLEALYPRLGAFLNGISNGADITGIAEVAAREVRALTGFNRVMFYTFDAIGDGTVLAEDGDGVLPSYRGQRFPAADIPAQARELYRQNRLRLIAASDYQPCPVEPALSPVDGRPLDLSNAALRSVSPVHLEYMRNMGTGASMSISLLVEGELWGLISAHNAEPRQVNAQVRTACEMLGQVLSLQIEARERADSAAERLALKQVETGLLGRLAVATTFQRGLAANATAWMNLTHAAGAAVVTEAGVVTVGLTPPQDEIREIAERLKETSEDVAVHDSLADLRPGAEAYAEQASGILAVSISQLHPDYIMWFRPEVVRTIDWSGDPTKAVEAGADRLHPRKSFEVWREQVRLRSLPWTAAEIDSARGFRNAIQDLVLKRAEERAELTGRLEQINKELESFSYSISHDLRAPFRHIVGYAELLTDRERDLSDKSRHYLQSITNSALSAGHLVDDLLHFSQLGRASLNMGPVDLGKMVEEVRRSMIHDIAGRSIEWRIGDLPRAWGDAAMIRQVLQNLLQNAVKYTGPRERAVITVEGETTSGGASYTVSDNGVGFEMAYVGKLFGVFQRLHRTEDFEGTGIGLALAKRIIERHGGSISAQGEPDKGAAFTFTLPARTGAQSGERLRG